MAPSRAPIKRIAIPSTDPLPHSLRLSPTDPTVIRTLSRLSRPALLALAAEWCSKPNISTCGPFLNSGFQPDDPSAPYSAATSAEELIDLYSDGLSSRRGTKREVLDRILDGDWRYGISLHQLAMADTRAVLDRSASGNGPHRWTAFHLVRIGTGRTSRARASPATKASHLPRVHAPTFLLSLHAKICALTRAHYYFTRPDSLPLTLLRISLFDTPYSSAESPLLPDVVARSKTLFIAFPDGTPYVYVSATASAARDFVGEAKSLQAFVIKAIPAALSRSQERYELQATSLTAHSLATLLSLRGPENGNAAAGGWSVYADEKAIASTLDYVAKGDTSGKEDEEKENKAPDQDGNKGKKALNKRTFEHANPTAMLSTAQHKKQKRAAAGRFGAAGKADDGKPITRFDVRVRDPYPGSSPITATSDDTSSTSAVERTKPNVRLSFQGTHVFAGIRKLVEIGVIDAMRMPGWMTGEGGVSVGDVVQGRIED